MRRKGTGDAPRSHSARGPHLELKRLLRGTQDAGALPHTRRLLDGGLLLVTEDSSAWGASLDGPSYTGPPPPGGGGVSGATPDLRCHPTPTPAAGQGHGTFAASSDAGARNKPCSLRPSSAEGGVEPWLSGGSEGTAVAPPGVGVEGVEQE